MISAAAPDRSEIGFRQREVAHQVPLLGRRVEQFRDLGFVQLLRSPPSPLLDLAPRRPTDPGQGVEKRAALDAESPTNSGLGGAAVERGCHRGEFLGVDGDGTTAAATTRTCVGSKCRLGTAAGAGAANPKTDTTSMSATVR